MMTLAGQRPGSGSYECDSCHEITILDDEDLLQKYSFCKSTQFLYVGGLVRNVRKYPPSQAEQYVRLVKRK